jgi:hypothetical protein
VTAAEATLNVDGWPTGGAGVARNALSKESLSAEQAAAEAAFDAGVIHRVVWITNTSTALRKTVT